MTLKDRMALIYLSLDCGNHLMSPPHILMCSAQHTEMADKCTLCDLVLYTEYRTSYTGFRDLLGVTIQLSDSTLLLYATGLYV